MSFRWLARICSLIGMFFLVGFFNTETMMNLDLKGWCLSILFPCVLLSSYILSWMYDRTGAIISVGVIALYYLLQFFFYRSFPEGSAFFLFTIPPVLFIIARWKENSSKLKSAN